MMKITGVAEYATALHDFDDLEYRRRGGSWTAPYEMLETPRQKELRAALRVYKPSFNE